MANDLNSDPRGAKSLSMIALTISVLSFALAAYDTYLNRDRDHLSVQPFLTFDYETDDDQDAVGLSVTNAGLGPAIIDSTTVYVDRKPVKDWTEASDYGHLPSDTVRYQDIEKGDAFRVGETELLFGQYTARHDHLQATAEFIDQHVAVSFTYHSLAGDTFTQCSSSERC